MTKNNKNVLGLALLILGGGSSSKAAENFITTVDAKTASLIAGATLTLGGICAHACQQYALSKRQDTLLNQVLEEFLQSERENERAQALAEQTLHDFIRQERERSVMLEQALAELEQKEYAEKAVRSILLVCALKAKQMLNEQEAYAAYLTNIDSIKDYCKEYAGPLPKHMYELASQEARKIGVDNVNFYLTNYTVSHAGQGGPYKILGLTPQTIEPSNAMRQGLGIGYWLEKLHRTLYHELCHLKCGHSSFLPPETIALIPNEHDSTTVTFLKMQLLMGIIHEKSDKNNDLANEMEAELGACYYLHQLKQMRYQWRDAVEDDEHPTNEEHKRYTSELLRRLDSNPHLSFDAVKELKALYLQEKKSGIKVMFADSQSTSGPASSSNYCS